METIQQLLDQIRIEMDFICESVREDHHKERDGIILYEYDNYTEEWFCQYSGYVYDGFDFTAKTFRDLLVICLAKFKKITKEITYSIGNQQSNKNLKEED